MHIFHSLAPRSRKNSWDFNQLTTKSVTVGAILGLRRAHSHTIATRHPPAARLSRTVSSRRMLAANFRCQKSALVAGVVAYRHPACRCQKQPCTKTVARNFGKIMSGLPVTSLAWRRYRNPRACNALRSVISGLVSFDLMPSIIRERVSWLTMSVTVVNPPVVYLAILIWCRTP